MHEDIAQDRLSEVPKSVRTSILAAREGLAPGTISSVARFFRTVAERGEHPSAPTRGTFEAACANESALALTLRALTAHAPEVSLAEGRALRAEYYRRRSAKENGCALQVKRVAEVERKAREWPEAWLAMLPGLRAAPLKQSTINRTIDSINRCAVLTKAIPLPPRLGWLYGMMLAHEAKRSAPEAGKTAVNDRTVANYIGALVTLGKYGGLDPVALAGLGRVQAKFVFSGRRLPKQKDGRVNDLYARGGYEHVTRIIVQLLDEADRLPDWSARAGVARATAAILAVSINEPARTGDMSRWRLGHELTRDVFGTWQLCWRQQKTGSWKRQTIWTEIGGVIDEHILGGRSPRHVHRRYMELEGANWLSFQAEPYASKWPSEQSRKALGVPLHDMRTLLADHLRLHDPATAPNLVQAMLGHRSQKAGDAYRSLCLGTGAQQEWQRVREVDAGKG